VAAEKLTPDRRRDLTRNALLDAAEVVFAKKGVNGASMEEIAAEAGFTRGAIYSNFGSKDELMLAVMQRLEDRQFERFSGAPPGADFAEGALTAAELFRETINLDLMPLELELRLNALRHPAARRRLVASDRAVSQRAAELVEQFTTEQGVSLKIPPRDLADIGRAAVIGLLQYAAVDEEEMARYEKLIETVFVLLTGAAVETPS
jgi:AcrR family transcriptional regulator